MALADSIASGLQPTSLVMSLSQVSIKFDIDRSLNLISFILRKNNYFVVAQQQHVVSSTALHCIGRQQYTTQQKQNGVQR